MRRGGLRHTLGRPEPLWLDVESEGWQLDPAALSAALDARGEDVAAVIATLTFGAAPSAAIAAGWRQACESHGTPLIVDAAAALGATRTTATRRSTPSGR